MTTATKTRDKVRQLNLQINSQLRGAGIIDHKGKLVKKLSDSPEGEWKEWMIELIALRDKLANECNF